MHTMKRVPAAVPGCSWAGDTGTCSHAGKDSACAVEQTLLGASAAFWGPGRVKNCGNAPLGAH